MARDSPAGTLVFRVGQEYDIVMARPKGCHMTRCFALVAVLVLLVGLVPLKSADREHEQLMADIRMLQEHSLQLQLMMGAINEALDGLSAKVDAQRDDVRRAFADQRLLVDNVSTGVRVLREKLDDTNVRISSLSQEVEALRISIPPAPPPLTQLLIDPETGLPMNVPVAAAAAPALIGAGVSPQRMYDTAWADYTNGQWALALQGFEAYIRTFPRSELADDAAFYIGQTHFAEGKFTESVDAFESVLLRYPDGDIVPEASYKRGLALDQLAEPDRARQAFELVVKNYPESNMAALAQQALDRLNQPSR